MRRGRPIARVAVRLAPLAAGVAVLGETGHRFLERWGGAVAHHLFHIVFGAAAVIAFAAAAAAEVARNGWPRFTWRLRPEPMTAREAPPPPPTAWPGRERAALEHPLHIDGRNTF